jgi:FemAB-related protein (PEP-CTERM system-associated)
MDNAVTITQYIGDDIAWEEYVNHQSGTSVYHKIGWRQIIAEAFGHEPIYLLAKQDDKIKGILPLFLMQSRIFGNYLISLPFIDRAGVIADDHETTARLCDRAIELAQEKQVDFLELRNPGEVQHPDLATISHKVNFILHSGSDPDFVWKKVLQKNVKNRVRIAQKNNVTIKVGSEIAFIHNFYNCYCINMKYLGTPVFPKKFFLNIHKQFSDQMIVLLALYNDKVIGGKIVLFFKDTAYFISQASMRQYSDYHPNNLLYWAAIEYACKNGYEYCDMGRSNIDSGPYRFKKQWGTIIQPLFWQYYLNKTDAIPKLNPTNPKFSLAINIWKRLPLVVTKIVGPLIARHIP